MGEIRKDYVGSFIKYTNIILYLLSLTSIICAVLFLLIFYFVNKNDPSVLYSALDSVTLSMVGALLTIGFTSLIGGVITRRFRELRSVAERSLLVTEMTESYSGIDLDKYSVIDCKLDRIREILSRVEVNTDDSFHVDGIQKLTRSVSVSELSESIKNSSDIYIVNTFLPNADQMTSHLTRAIMSGSNVRVLMSDPHGPYAQLRALDLSKTTSESIRRGVEDSLSALSKVNNQLSEFTGIDNKKKGLLKVRLFKETAPSTAIYGFDRKIYLFLYWQRRLAVDGFCLLVDPLSEFGRMISEDFETMWGECYKKHRIDTIDISKWRDELKKAKRVEV